MRFSLGRIGVEYAFGREQSGLQRNAEGAASRAYAAGVVSHRALLWGELSGSSFRSTLLERDWPTADGPLPLCFFRMVIGSLELVFPKGRRAALRVSA